MLALRLALCELRAGVRDFRMFVACLVIGVTVIATVGMLEDRIEKGIHEQAKTLLGGDVEISLTNARATPEQLAFLRSYGRTSLAVSLRAMATFGEQNVLTELKGVDESYPLLGTTRLVSGRSLQIALKSGIVTEQSLLDRLGAKTGDRIIIGAAAFTVGDALLQEPDRIASAFSLGPHVLARVGELEKAGLLLPGSLIRYHYHVLLNDPAQLGAFKSALGNKFPHAGWIVKTFGESNQTVQNLVERLQLFLTLAGLSSLLIGGVGIMNAAEAYISRKYETIATMKTLGAPRRTIFTLYIIVIFLMALLGTLISAVAGAGLSLLILPTLAQYFPVSHEAGIAPRPLLLAMLFGMLTVFTFAIAALGRGVEVNPALLFRGFGPTRAKLPAGKLIANIVLAGALIATLLLSASDFKIAVGFIFSALACFVIFSGAAWLVRHASARIHPAKPWTRLGIANLHRPGAPTFSIMLSIGIGLTVLIALLQVEGNFEREINETIPAEAPSLFLIDIQPTQKDEFLTLLHAKPYVSGIDAMPMVRGRIAKLKGVPVENAPIDPGVKWATESDRGFSYAAAPPADSTIVKGEWWPTNYHGKPLVSLDRRLAEGMKLKAGDTMTITILGQDIETQIASLREVNYANFHINFACILSPGALETFPATFIATARVDTPEHETDLIRETAKRFPNISVIRIRDSLAELRDIVGHIATAVRITALTTLISGILVLASALAATLDKRAHDIVVFKVLGARRSDILRSFLTEWVVLALITSLLACLLGSCGAWLILKRLDWVAFHFLPGAALKTILLALVFVSTTGFIVHSRILSMRAGTLLRNE